MQLKKLTLATLLALSLAACGGGDDDGTNQPVDPVDPTDPVDPVDPGTTGSNDETQPSLDDFKYAVPFKVESTPSTGSFVLTRQEKSSFDTSVLAGKAQYANRMASLENDSATTGNAGLTNILLAQAVDYGSSVDVTNEDAVMIEYVGVNPGVLDGDLLHSIHELQNPGHTHNGTEGGKGKMDGSPSLTNGFHNATSADAARGATELQQLNQPNVIVVGSGLAYTATNAGASKVVAMVQDTSEAEAGSPNNLSGTAPAKFDYYDGTKRTAAQTAYTNYVTAKENVVKANDSAARSAAGTAFETAEEKWKEEKSAIEIALRDQFEQVNGFKPDSTMASGFDVIPVATVKGDFAAGEVDLLFAYEYAGGVPNRTKPLTTQNSYTNKANMTPNLTTAMDSGLVYIKGKTEYGNDDSYKTNTRIFGHYYLDPGAKEFDGEATLTDEDYNTYLYGDVVGFGTQYGSLAVKPETLNYVQYGRVTANLDEDKSKHPHLKDDGSVEFRVSPLAPKDGSYGESAVDSYFYRGVGVTTIAQMDSLASNAKINYQGHAIMFGLDNSFHGAKTSGNGHSNATILSSSDKAGLGNFVEATFDVGAKTVQGDIYNVWSSKEKFDNGGKKVDKYTKVNDSLVVFEGKVFGNTVIGDAVLTYDADAPKGELRGSFFGPSANEFGGSISSVSHKEEYGMKSGIGWGGVFGAKRVDAPRKTSVTHIIDWDKITK
ncbi:MAG: transferrin-binding protein-like solute binding protein [Neisseriaceae bacterium]|nr:transferrin-binding protein-like solute binding protein [Neisseriaceae bacterium]